MKSHRRFIYVLTLPVVIVLFGLLIFPLISTLFISTQSTLDGLDNMSFVGLKNYYDFLTSPVIHHSILITTVFVISTLSATTLFGFFIALLLNDIKWGAAIFRTLIIIPLAIAPVVAGLTWRVMLDPLFGVVNYLIGFIGIPPLGWAAEIKTALFTLIIVDTWQWTPFMTIILYAGLQMLPVDVFEAGKIDGVSRFQEIQYITIPLLKPLFIIALIFRFMDAFKSFDIIYAITKGGPGHATETLVIRAFFETFKYHKHEVGAVIGVFLLIVTFAMTKFALKALEAKDA